jgi:hypothetical protein
MADYNRSTEASGGGAGYGLDRGGSWPDGTAKSMTSRGDRPDPRYPQLPPGVPVPGKNFASRPELVTSAPRGGGEVRIGPGSAQWTRGQGAVLNKVSYTLANVNGPRRRPR